MTLVIAFFTFPVIFMALVSLKGQSDISTGHIFPSVLFWQNYPDAFRSVALVSYLRNSAIVATCGAALTLLIAVPATHAIVRFNLGKTWLPSMILGAYVAPPIVALFPLFFLLKTVGLVNSHLGLIVVYGVMNLPVAFWLMSSFVRRLPVELEEAARVDGVSYFRTLRSIVIPLLMPGIASTGIICMILSYNEFLFASFLARSVDTQTVPIGLSLFQGDRQLRFGQIAVATLTAMLPVYILAALFQRGLVGGLTKGMGK
jgi:multiple sugar transport system permease protein